MSYRSHQPHGHERFCTKCDKKISAIDGINPQCTTPYCDGFCLLVGMPADIIGRLTDGLTDGISDATGDAMGDVFTKIITKGGDEVTNGVADVIRELFWMLREAWLKPFPSTPFPWNVFAETGLLDTMPLRVGAMAKHWANGTQPVIRMDGTPNGMLAMRAIIRSPLTGDDMLFGSDDE